VDAKEIEQIRLAYKAATDQWVSAIREEEALATTNRSMFTMENWDAAQFKTQDAGTKATKAREAYQDALRGVNYGI
jgi:hypothetical protein